LKTPSIAIVSGSHLCHNPRVLKEAITLGDAGYNVEVIGGWFDETLKARDQELLSRLNVNFTPAVDFVEKNGPLRLISRVRRKVGEIAHVAGGLENEAQLGIFVPALRRAASNSAANLLIAHSEPAMAAVTTAARKRERRRVGVDMEDWFSEDGTAEAKRLRPVRLLRSLERSLLTRGAHTSSPSHSMSEALAREFDCNAPTVIYNAFEWSDRRVLDGQVKDRRNPRLPSIHWYSQTIGMGRGLEDLFAALPHLRYEAEIHLRGNPTTDFNKAMSEVPRSWRDRIFIHALVKNDELLSRIAEHDIGFAGEMKHCRSRDLTVTNKILHYLLAGLAVVASDTAGQREISERAPEAVLIYASGDSHALANHLNLLLSFPERLQAAKASALSAAQQTFCWERQAPLLLRSIETAFAATS
jgi:glycosyltransferase involved in cell wall biosynthesis